MRDAATYRDKAAQFRKMASEADEESAAALRQLADEYEWLALRIEPELKVPPHE